MNKIARALLLACTACAVLSQQPSVKAQTPSTATVVTACGTAPFTYTAGQNRPVVQDINGVLCTGSGGGGAGAVTVANGADVTQGAIADAAYAGSGNATVISGLKGLYNAAIAPLPAGSAIIGKVGIDQTTPGTTNGVQVNAALPAGSAIIGNVRIDQTTPGTTNGTVPSGNAASGAADSGNPLKTGGKYSSTKPTFTDGQRGDTQLSSRGATIVQIASEDSVTMARITAAPSDGQSNSTPALTTNGLNSIFNGTTWDRGFTCPNSAVVNVTAAATTEIVALTASQTIRVCSFSVSMSAAGTAAFVYGTGTNCGTGTTSLTGAMPLATGTPLSNTATAGGSLFRTASANAICVAAVTGNVVGFITYAKY